MADSDAHRILGVLNTGPIAVLTGAGLSTASGIPAYRDAQGVWRHPQPIQHQAFLKAASVRARYWARSYFGWQTMSGARPNPGHNALAALQRAGDVSVIITQNVDGLHQAAGSDCVVELHGSVHRVICLSCGARFARQEVQHWLAQRNPQLLDTPYRPPSLAPDGDSDIEDALAASVTPPDCIVCGGVLKPDVVFFGDNVPRDRVERASAAVADAAALLVVGSTLTVFSGFRFARMASELGKPVIAINLGVTRADPLLSLKIVADCAVVLDAVAKARQFGNVVSLTG